MIHHIVQFALRQRFLVLMVAVFVIVAGAISFQRMPVDAYPDLSPPLVEIITQWPGHAAEETERLVTLPIELQMNGVPHMEFMRSISLYGLSDVIMTFQEDTDNYFARQVVFERLSDATLPPGVTGSLAPLSSPSNLVYRYVIESPDRTPQELKTYEDWVIERAYKSVPGVADDVADLCLESEASTALAMRLARAYDEAGNDAREGVDDSDAQLFKRVATAVGKYWACKRAPNHAFEAMECLGGNGYVEDSGMPRLYREAPLTSIWEGSGNVISLDVLRALSRSPRSLEVFLAEVELAQGADARLDAHVQRLKSQFADPATLESRARRVVEGMALALEGSLLVRGAPTAVADAFCASRLGGDGGLEYGTLPAGSDFKTIIARSRPQV